jgi:hypothetical protein
MMTAKLSDSVDPLSLDENSTTRGQFTVNLCAFALPKVLRLR